MSENQQRTFEPGYRWLLCLNCDRPHTVFAHTKCEAPIIECGCGFSSRFARGCIVVLDETRPNTRDPKSYQALNEVFGYLEPTN